MIDLLILLLAQGPATAAPVPADPAAAAPPAVRAKAKANLASLVRLYDYPPRAFERREQGQVFFELTVGPAGRVTACRVTCSSGSTELDNATCRIMRKRARFVPARDSDGRPVPDTVASSLIWRQF